MLARQASGGLTDLTGDVRALGWGSSLKKGYLLFGGIMLHGMSSLLKGRVRLRPGSGAGDVSVRDASASEVCRDPEQREEQRISEGGPEPPTGHEAGVLFPNRADQCGLGGEGSGSFFHIPGEAFLDHFGADCTSPGACPGMTGFNLNSVCFPFLAGINSIVETGSRHQQQKERNACNFDDGILIAFHAALR